MKKYKLTDQDGYTMRGTKLETRWEVGKTVRVTGKGNKLCTNQVLHFYFSPLLAVLLNPIHAGIKNPRLFEVKGCCIAREHQLKGGAKALTVVRELELPVFTVNQRVAFAIYCALEVCQDVQFIEWANNWISGVDRSAISARAATWAAAWAVRAAVNADAVNAARAAELAASTKPTINLIKIAEKAYQFER